MADVDLRKELDQTKVGDVPRPDVRCILQLAREFQHVEDPNAASVSWANQVKAQDYLNKHGLGRALDELFRLREARGCVEDSE